jgi:hypothetical protein
VPVGVPATDSNPTQVLLDPALLDDVAALARAAAASVDDVASTEGAFTSRADPPSR